MASFQCGVGMEQDTPLQVATPTLPHLYTKIYFQVHGIGKQHAIVSKPRTWQLAEVHTQQGPLDVALISLSRQHLVLLW